jgi:hypothetical protein
VQRRAPATTTTNAVLLSTLNCYWFFGEEDSQHADKPPSREQYSLKAGHLIGLLPRQTPLFVGLQEIGNGDDVRALAHAANRRYGGDYQHLFVQGRDTATRQDVGALLDVSTGWGVDDRPSRVGIPACREPERSESAGGLGFSACACAL